MSLTSARHWLAGNALLAGLLCCLNVGCDANSGTDLTDRGPSDSSPAANPVVATLVLSEMPSGEVLTPTAIKELGGEPTSTVLAGRIDAGDIDPFQQDEVGFMISQLPDEGHGADDPDHADNCPFCKHKLENAPKAIVQFFGPDGKVLSGDPRETLSLEKGDIVYVAGTAQYNPAVNTVMVNATGVFRGPKK